MRLRPGYLVVALTLFATIAVGMTGAILLARSKAATLAAVADRQRLLVSLQARLIDVEVTRLLGEMTRLSQLAEVDLADRNLEPEKRVLRIARRDTALFSVAIVILDERGTIVWSEPEGTTLGQSGAALVGEARGRGRAVLSLAPGEIDVTAPIAGRGAIAGKVPVARRDLFGETLQRAAQSGGAVELLEVTSAGAPILTVSGAGSPVPRDLSAAGGQAWLRDREGLRWLVTESRVGDGPLLLRLVQPAQQLEAEVGRSYQSLVALVGALLALAIGRLERAEMELGRSRSLAAMGKASAAIAHEVKNSLNGLSVALDLLAERRAAPAAAAAVHAQARSEIARLRGVADDLTLFAATPRLDLADTVILELCQRAVHAVSDVAQDYAIAVTVQAPGCEALRIHADPNRLLGALQNVIRNGLESMGPGAFGEALGAPAPVHERRLELAIRRDEDCAVVEVSDRGPGIPPAIRPRLFEPFVTTKRGGTGLGLAIARRVVEAHGGRIEVADRVGGGSLFRIRLPIAPVTPRRRPETAPSTVE